MEQPTDDIFSSKLDRSQGGGQGYGDKREKEGGKRHDLSRE